MSKKRLFFVFVAIVFVLLAISAFLMINIGIEPEENQEQNPVKEEQKILSPDETIQQL